MLVVYQYLLLFLTLTPDALLELQPHLNVLPQRLHFSAVTKSPEVVSCIKKTFFLLLSSTKVDKTVNEASYRWDNELCFWDWDEMIWCSSAAIRWTTISVGSMLSLIVPRVKIQWPVEALFTVESKYKYGCQGYVHSRCRKVTGTATPRLFGFRHQRRY